MNCINGRTPDENRCGDLYARVSGRSGQGRTGAGTIPGSSGATAVGAQGSAGKLGQGWHAWDNDNGISSREPLPGSALETMRLDYPVALLCRVFEVSPSGFYAWLARKPSRRRQTDERLKIAIKAVHRQIRETHGACRMQPELAAHGVLAGPDRIGGCGGNWACAASKSASSKPRPIPSMSWRWRLICWSSNSNRRLQASDGWSTSLMYLPEKAGFTLTIASCRTGLACRRQCPVREIASITLRWKASGTASKMI